MKGLKIYIFTAVTIWFGTACEDNLELLPVDTLVPEAFYTDTDNFTAALYGIYDGIQATTMYGNTPLLDGISDNGICINFNTDLVNYAIGIATANSNDRIRDYYQSPYIVIQRANALLDNIDIDGSITPEERNAVEGEARALRALAYVRLAYLFGDVPLIKVPISRSEILEISSTNRDEIIDFVLSELAISVDLLNTSPYEGIKGRLTKQAVMALQGKVLLFEARMGNKPWSDALTVLSEAKNTAENAGNGLVISGDGSDGVANYRSIFVESNEGNEEMLISCNFDDIDRSAGLFEHYSPGAGTLYLSVHSNFVDDYYTTDGLPIDDPGSIYDAGDPFVNRDPRMYSTVLFEGALYSTGSTLLPFEPGVSNPLNVTPYMMYKFVSVEGGTEVNRGWVDMPVLRFADLLLMFAEAENEVNGPTAEAYDAVNQIRARVNMPGFPNGLSKDNFREEVLHERRMELAFEGHRWFDLITLGIADEKINTIDEGLGRKFVSDKQELFPIPQVERDLNPNLSQNTGY